MARLTFISPDFNGQTCELPDGETPVGRSKAADLVIAHASVSADHCKILVHGPEVIVQEHQPKNGLWVDGLRINGQTQVKHGQTIRFGTVEAILSLPEITYDHSSTISAVHLHWRDSRQSATPTPLAPEGKRIVRPQIQPAGATSTAVSEPPRHSPPIQKGAPINLSSDEDMEPVSRYWMALAAAGTILGSLFFFAH